MKLIESIEEMQSTAINARQAGKTVALVPTMGYLHAGHASLMDEGRKRADILVASIFVNPTQFGAGEDFNTYPRDLEKDKLIAKAAGVDYIFAPKASDMYPTGYQTYVNVEKLTRPLCGASRPGHFRGVTTVVAKLFNIVMPHLALFGKKDFQQLTVIRRMAADLNMTVQIVGMPIVRESDGLAMSSRNAYLSQAERQSALCLSLALQSVRGAFRSGERSVEALRKLALDIINAEAFAVIDYVEFYHEATLTEVEQADDRTLVALAVKIGKTRLIDNCVLGED
ncbi:pantoate--beta-alanine ligase [Geotalea uraniireducens]|uniref:Pantothenate synthetase n=1 Tax=Geotalea uraniireducens (strain Rf4) TaxID=351605 RepID=PANC_GEOUR|nr:pantoate--beta-alanine ligase [Geotalea uraniireducens]A5G3A1.1 RecName: Full=Pantothenate synthetase; Short=PS; AltName: Full=Pantoate--beta-alanine ligase; AltName: Full=Pantoate-activating enzyme [Geotalea uraniireducens Rf4]ABQ26269.1 pantothenate synthetase [Geotalea uraniireducens Rf4]